MQKTFKDNFLEGKVALVTGGATGICFDIAESYRRYGATVCIMSRKQKNIDEAVEELSASKAPNAEEAVYGYSADVRKYEQVEQAVDFFLSKTGGKIDILINGAAGNFIAPFESISANAFKTVIDIDLIGTFNVSKVVYLKSMREHGGNIINISAWLHGVILESHAGSAKAGVDNLTQSLAVELGPKGIRVNGIVPGAIDGTAGFDKLSPKDSNKNSLASVCPLQRLGTKEDISNAALFLASDASSFISGHNIVVDGASKIAFPNFPLLSDEIRNKWSSKL